MKAAMTLLTLRNPNFRRVGALICLGFFLVLPLFAACEPLHKLLHHDADAPDHHCAITMLAQGQLDAPNVLLPLIGFIAASVIFLPLLQSVFFSSFDYRFSSTRAPPVSFLH
jgi:hypothetical protein